MFTYIMQGTRVFCEQRRPGEAGPVLLAQPRAVGHAAVLHVPLPDGLLRLHRQVRGRGGDRIAFVAVGNAIASVAYVAIFSVCNITGEEKQGGTLTPLLVTPANRMAMFVGRAMFQVLNGIATVFIALFYAWAVFDVDFSMTNWPALIVVVVLTSLTTVGFGLMLSSFGLYLRTSMVIANIFLFIGLLFSGVNFPVTYLPDYLQPLAYIFPLTYGTEAAREAVSGTSLLGMADLLIAQMIVGTIALLIGYLIFKLFEDLSRRLGTMDKF